jgi:hypothetical protein
MVVMKNIFIANAIATRNTVIGSTTLNVANKAKVDVIIARVAAILNLKL